MIDLQEVLCNTALDFQDLGLFSPSLLVQFATVGEVFPFPLECLGRGKYPKEDPQKFEWPVSL